MKMTSNIIVSAGIKELEVTIEGEGGELKYKYSIDQKDDESVRILAANLFRLGYNCKANEVRNQLQSFLLF